MPFPNGYSSYAGLEVARSGNECYLHCSNLNGCELQLIEDYSVLGNGSVAFEYYSPVYGAYIDFYIDDLKITIEYYMEGQSPNYEFVYDIKVYNGDGVLLYTNNQLNMTKTKIKIEWYGGKILNIYLWNETDWGKIADIDVAYSTGEWKMNIKGPIEIYNLEVYRRWI